MNRAAAAPAPPVTPPISLPISLRLAPFAALAFAVLLAPVAAGEGPANVEAGTTDLADLRLDLGALSTEPQAFEVVMRSMPREGVDATLEISATLTLRTEYEDSRILLSDTVELGDRVYSSNTVCEPNATLALVQGEMRVDRDGHSIVGTARRDAETDTLHVRIDASAGSFDYPAETVTKSALLRIVTLLPREEGRVYAFDAYSSLTNLQPKRADADERCTITCVGPTTISVDGETVSCTRYVANFEGDLTFYVDQDDTLRRLVADHGQTEMTLTEPRAVFADVVPELEGE